MREARKTPVLSTRSVDSINYWSSTTTPEHGTPARTGRDQALGLDAHSICRGGVEIWSPLHGNKSDRRASLYAHAGFRHIQKHLPFFGGPGSAQQRLAF